LQVLTAIAEQFAYPHGRAAPMIAVLLNVVNRATVRAAVESLDARAGQCVVDLGFGGASALRLLLDRVGPTGRVIGVDPSPEMRARAERRFRREVAAGRVAVFDGAASSIPLEDGSVDGLVTINTVYFWHDVPAGLAEIRRVLRKGGRAVVAVRPSALSSHARYYGPPAPPDPQQLSRLADAAGFSDVAVGEPARDTVTVTGRAG
jgi:arsenite methyltransferase